MEVLSLKWNNHQTVFSHQISELRRKTVYTDATLACHGKFYQVHRLVLSTCSEYFNAIFSHTPCKNPVVVLKDMTCKDLEFLLDYMYAGEVNVRQIELPSLISAAESLQIKGLAISDEKYDCSDKNEPKTKLNDKRIGRNEMYNSARIENLGNERSPTDTSIDPITEKLNNTDKLYKKNNDAHTPSKSERIPQLGMHDSYTTVIKTEPDQDSSSYESSLKDEPCTSHREDDDMSNKDDTSKYQFFSNEADFSDHLSNNLISPPLQNETLGNLLSVDTTSTKMLPQGPFLQLPLSGVIGRGSRTGVERRDSENKESDSSSPVKRDYLCSFCGRAFSHRTNQLAHERIHTGEKPFRCLYCPFRTALKGNLKNHIFSRHHGDWKSIKHLIFASKDS